MSSVVFKSPISLYRTKQEIADPPSLSVPPPPQPRLFLEKKDYDVNGVETVMESIATVPFPIHISSKEEVAAQSQLRGQR
jgi:hypothetical protein